MQEIDDKIKQKLKKQGRSQRWLAKEMGITDTQLRNLFKEDLGDWKYKYVLVLKKYKIL